MIVEVASVEVAMNFLLIMLWLRVLSLAGAFVSDIICLEGTAVDSS